MNEGKARAGSLSKVTKKLSLAKSCFVCGDRALGYNFNAWTCESCKAFFRRNALKSKEWTCPFSNACAISPITRRFCQKCRLKKCFAIGMKKEFIMTDEEKRVKQLKKSQSKARKESVVSSMSTDSDVAGDNVLDMVCDNGQNVSISSTSSSNGGSGLLSDLVDLQDSYNLQSHFNAAVEEFYRLDDSQLLAFGGLGPFDSPASVQQTTFQNVQETEFAQEQAVPVQSAYSRIAEATFAPTPLRLNYEQLIKKNGVSSSNKLNELEGQFMAELVDAYAIIKEKMVENATCPRKPTLADIVRMTDSAIRRLITLCKKVPSFQRLCEDDQIALLKGGCAPLMVLKSVMSYNSNSDCWTDANDSCILKMEVLKQASGNLYDVHRTFIESFRPEWRTDEKIMLLLGAVTLFSPERPNVVHVTSVRLQQQSYMFLLRRYIESSAESLCEADETFVQLMQKLDELVAFNEDVVRIILDHNPKMLEPLLVEIFDLK